MWGSVTWKALISWEYLNFIPRRLDTKPTNRSLGITDMVNKKGIMRTGMAMLLNSVSGCSRSPAHRSSVAVGFIIVPPRLMMMGSSYFERFCGDFSFHSTRRRSSTAAGQIDRGFFAARKRPIKACVGGSSDMHPPRYTGKLQVGCVSMSLILL